MTSSFSDLYSSFEFSRLGAEQFISASESAQLRKVDLSTVSIQSGPRSVTNCLALEKHEYRYLLSGSLSGTISLYDLQQPLWNKQPISPLLEHLDQLTGTVASLQWYPEDTGAFVTASMRGEVSIFDTNQFVKVATFQFPGNVVYAARMRTGLQPLIAVALQDGSVRLCDPRTRDSSHVLKGHSRAVTRVEWSPSPGEGHVLTSAGMDGAVRVWDIRRAGGLKEAALRSLDWRGDFRSSARVNTSKLHTSLLSLGNYSNSYSSTGSRDATVVIADSTPWYQPNRSSSDQSAARAHDAAVSALQFTSCGRFLMTAGNDRQLRLWRVATAELLPVKYPDKVVPSSQLPFDLCIAESQFSADDMLLAPASSGISVECSCNVPALNTSSAAGSSGGNGTNKQGPVSTKEGDILLIPVHSSDGQPVRILKGHLDRVTSIVYRRPNQQIISAAKDGMIFMWDAKKLGGNQQQQSSARASGSRHNELYYGAAGGRRYDFAQVTERVLGPAAQGGSSAAAAVVGLEGGGGGEVVQARGAVRRELPVREFISGTMDRNGNSLRGAHQGRTVAGADPASDSSESGDNWSDEEEVGREVVINPGKRGGGGHMGGQSKAARIVMGALAGVMGPGLVQAPTPQLDAPPAPSSSRGSSSNGGGGTSSRSGRFVPPIIQRYLQEAGRGAPRASPAADSSSAPTRAPLSVSSSGRDRGSSNMGQAAVPPTTLPPHSWDDVDALFQLNHTAHVGLGGFLASSTIPEVSGGRFAPESPSALDGRNVEISSRNTVVAPPVAQNADQRYKAWLKQQRSKGSTKKK